ncbi:hypothetical protein V6N13_043306 [Hibiscus sabdariffa]|uniref:Uncharacterized protein n=1 Tax=Hibiscus sabdariffa TaxID=183260 RepID=A0ABR2G2V8_9ROSI
MDKSQFKPGSTGGKTIKARGSAGRNLNESHRRGFQLKKPVEIKTHSQHVLIEWMHDFSRKLDSNVNISSAIVSDVNVVVFHGEENSSSKVDNLLELLQSR